MENSRGQEKSFNFMYEVMWLESPLKCVLSGCCCTGGGSSQGWAVKNFLTNWTRNWFIPPLAMLSCDICRVFSYIPGLSLSTENAVCWNTNCWCLDIDVGLSHACAWKICIPMPQFVGVLWLPIIACFMSCQSVTLPCLLPQVSRFPTNPCCGWCLLCGFFFCAV